MESLRDSNMSIPLMAVIRVGEAHHTDQEDTVLQEVHTRLQEAVAAIHLPAIRTYSPRDSVEERITPMVWEDHPLVAANPSAVDHPTTLEVEGPCHPVAVDHLTTTQEVSHLDSHLVTAEGSHPACHPEEVATADLHSLYQRPCRPSTNLP